jgi:hypothetical protein
MRGKKLAILCGMIVTAGLFLAGAAGATERCVLGEMFAIAST